MRKRATERRSSPKVEREGDGKVGRKERSRRAKAALEAFVQLLAEVSNEQRIVPDGV